MTNLPSKITRAVVLFVVFFWLTNVLSARAQTSDAIADLAARVNRERLSRGLVPLALNVELGAAAQGHADDIARTGRIRSAQEGHVGSDGSTVFDRVARTGYGAYSWGRRLGENWAWYHSVTDAMAMWMDSAPHRNNILHPLYREMGIGVTATPQGGFVFIINFGAQPNVLPIFINDGADETRSLDVKITLSNEDVMPNSDGENVIGRPVEVQISSTADFAGAKRQFYTQNINWTLAPGGGTKTVYVKYRDAKGRAATASDSIVYAAPGTPVATKPLPTHTATRASRPTVTTTLTPVPTEVPTETPTATPTLAATEVMPVETATPTFAAVETASPAPTRASPSSEIAKANAMLDLSVLGFSGILVMFAVLAIKYCKSLR